MRSNLQLPTDMNIEVADSIAACIQNCAEILSLLQKSVSGYLVAGFHLVWESSAVRKI
jgi:hypothetical protein